MSVYLRGDGTFEVDQVIHPIERLGEHLDDLIALAPDFTVGTFLLILESSPSFWGEVVGNSEASVRAWLAGWRLPNPGDDSDDDPLTHLEVAYYHLKASKRFKERGSWRCSGVAISGERYGLSFAGPVTLKHLPLTLNPLGMEVSIDGSSEETTFPMECTVRTFIWTVWEEICGFEEPGEAAAISNLILDRLDELDSRG